MKQRNILASLDNYVIYTDANNKTRLLAITQEDKNILDEKYIQYKSFSNFPDSELVEVYELKKVREKDARTDDYDIIDEKPLLFPVRQLEFTFIKLVHE